MSQQNTTAPDTGAKKGKSSLLVVLCIVLALLLAAAGGAMLFMLGGRSAEDTVSAYMDGLLGKTEPRISADLVPAKYLVEAGKATGRSGEQIIAELNCYTRIVDLLKANGTNISWQAGKPTPVSGEERAAINQFYSSYHLTVKDALRFPVTITAEDSQTAEFTLVKIGRDWYLHLERLSRGQQAAQAADALMAMVLEGSADPLFESLPEPILNSMLARAQLDKEQLRTRLNTLFKDVHESIDAFSSLLGKTLTADYEIGQPKALSDEELLDAYHSYHAASADVCVTDGAIVPVELSVSAGELRDSGTIEIFMIQANGQWYPDLSLFLQD